MSIESIGDGCGLMRDLSNMNCSGTWKIPFCMSTLEELREGYEYVNM